MKKLSILAVLLTLAFTSCSESDSVFDTVASERIDALQVLTEEVLCAAPNGWDMAYFYDQTLVYGGYHMYLKFDNGVVVVSSELGDDDEKAQSLYSYDQDLGATINFDTYNYLFHYFSEPSSINPLGYGGDYEFTIVSASEDLVVFRGKRYGVECRLTPLSADSTWAELFAAYRPDAETMDKIGDMDRTSYKNITDLYELKVNGVTYDVYRYEKLRALYIQTESGEIQVPYIYTTTGLEFYEDVTIEGVTLAGLSWDKSDDSFYSEDGMAYLTKIGQLD